MKGFLTGKAKFSIIAKKGLTINGQEGVRCWVLGVRESNHGVHKRRSVPGTWLLVVSGRIPIFTD